MGAPLWQVDAFSARPFGGNPAAVVLLDRWREDGWLRAVAAENNLSETAFLVRRATAEPSVPGGVDYELRWFTPVAEVDLCGHATLAAGAVVLTEIDRGSPVVTFWASSGPLAVEPAGSGFALDFPSRIGRPAKAPDDVEAVIGARPVEVLSTERDLYLVLEDARTVCLLEPDMRRLTEWPWLGVGVAAAGPSEGAPSGERIDFVSRFFAPALGVDEDPVTGSAHCTWGPYFCGVLGRERVVGRQVSQREGIVTAEPRGSRVRLEGSTALVLRGSLVLPDVGFD